MHQSSYVLRIGLALLPLALLSACASGPSNIQIKFHQLTAGDQFACQTTDKEEKCQMIPPRSAEAQNKGGTVHVIPPNSCQGRFNVITIEELDSDSPRMYVVCSPVEN